MILEDCKVPVKNLIGKEGQGFSIAMVHLLLLFYLLGFNLIKDKTKKRKV